MQLNDISNLTGLFQDIDFDCSTTLNTYPTKDKARNINIEYDELVEFYYRESKKIKPAQTDTSAPFNVVTYNVSSGTATVTISDVFRADKFEIIDSAGKYHELELITVNDIEGAVGAFQTNAGVPKYIKIDGTQATLFPTPNYSATNGLIIYTAEIPTLFSASDTTKTPELPRFTHRILSAGASIRYCNIYKQDRVSALLLEKQNLLAQFKSYLESRDKQKSTIKPLRTNMK